VDQTPFPGMLPTKTSSRCAPGDFQGRQVFEPDALIVDHLPWALGGELSRTLAHARSTRPALRAGSARRAANPETVQRTGLIPPGGSSAGLLRCHLDLWDPAVYDPVREYGIFS